MQVSELFRKLKDPLRTLNRDKYADLHAQQEISRRQLQLVQE